jgi:photosystem II stability/assembly factor-like uncharacterized protein
MLAVTMRRPSSSLLVLATIAPLLSGSGAAPGLRGADDTPRPEDPEARSAYWMMQRTYPGTRVPGDAWARAQAPFRADRRRPRDGGPLAWKSVGPAPLDSSKGAYGTPNMSPSAGRAAAVAVDPTDPKTIYAGYAIGGVWKSVDAGTTWAPLMDLEPTLAVGAIALDPATTPPTLYVGTGEPTPYIGYLGQGILRSTDGGKTFAKIGGTVFDGLVVGRIFIDGGHIYAATMFGAHGRGQNCNSDYDAPGQGLYRSSDGGQTWSLLKAGKIIDLEVDTSVTPRRLLVSDYATGAFWSADDGATWTAAMGLPTAQSTPKARRIELAFSKANPQVVYAGMGLGSAAALFVSTDGGQSFVQMAGAPDYCQTQCYYDNSIIVDPTDEKTVYLGGGLCGVWKTTNGTDPAPTWANISLPNGDCKGGAAWATAYVHPDIHGFAFDPTTPATLYVAGDGGIARTLNGGQTWTQLNDGVGTTQIYAMCADPGDPNAIYGGAQDSGVFAKTSSGWRAVVAADGGPCAVDPHNPTNVLAATEYAVIARTTTAFKITPEFVFDADPGSCQMGEPGCGDRVTFIAPVTVDPSTKGTFYVGTYRVWKSDAGGSESSWKAISDDLTAGAKSIQCAEASSFKMLDDGLTVITVAPSAPGVIYTGSQSGRVFGTKDGGATWTRLDKPPLPARWVSGIAVDPRDPSIVFASFSGFGDNTPNTPGHVFRSTDGGATWALRDIEDDAPVDTLIAHPVASDLLYAGTDAGVLVTTDGGKSWSALGDGLPHVPVYALVYHRAASALYAGTFGRSAWSVGLPQGAITASPMKLAFTAAAGAAAPPAQAVSISAADPRGGITHFTVAAADSWATVDVTAGDAAGAAPIKTNVTVTPGKLAAGDHDTTITITPDGGTPVTVPVRLTITPPTAPPKSEGGCACRAGAAEGDDAWPALLPLAAIALIRARRKRLCSRA